MRSAPRSSISAACHLQTPFGVQIITIVVGIFIWELIGRAGLLFPELFPSFVEILQSLWVYLTTPVVLPHLKASGYEVGGALASRRCSACRWASFGGAAKVGSKWSSR